MKGLVLLQPLKNNVTAALREFSQKRLTSIALPAVGTGNSNYPHADVARTLVSATVEFLNSNPSTTLNKVNFVSYSDKIMWQVSE